MYLYVIGVMCHSRGEGILIVISKDIPSQFVHIFDKSIEHLSIIFLLNGRKFIVSSIYLPPNSPISSYKIFTNTIQNLDCSQPDNFFICSGNFNLPDLSQSNNNFGLIYSSNNEVKVPYLPESFALLNFFKINKIANLFGTLLDLISVSCSNLSTNPALDPLVPKYIYHPALSINLHYLYSFLHLNHSLLMIFGVPILKKYLTFCYILTGLQLFP